MKLDHFIRSQMDAILIEWESFAKTLTPAAGSMDAAALRDHAKQILEDIALDIETRQNPAEQLAKSKGLSPDEEASSAASIHGSLRHASNFSLLQLSAEFRALRATVLRLWLPKVEQMSADAVNQMIRFNEAIDQALAESVVTYSSRADHTRDLYMAILGHDLRAPLSNMSSAGDLLRLTPVNTGQAVELGQRIGRSVKLMSSMVEDLIGYTRTQLGGGMPTVLGAADLGTVCRAALDDARATHPSRRFELAVYGGLSGRFDAVRVQQLLTNLMINAAQYGTRETAIQIVASAPASRLTVAVTNDGPPIAPEALEAIFSPLIQLPIGDEDVRPRTSLGLGLYVAKEIALAHDGSLSVRSDEASGTTFTLDIPRNPHPQR
ncbi:MAG: HAMP domain-containing sensor histidine kinase [Pseudomonadota bacterium]